MKTLTIVLIAVLFCPLLGAQDFIRLKEGGAVKGEIIIENDEKLVLIDAMGETVTVLRVDIERLRKGKPLAAKTQEQLDLVTEKNADSLFAVVLWAAEQKSLRRDAERLARRVLVMSPEHKQARAFLGHVKGLGVWYPDAETALLAVQEKMTADGFVYANGGWIRAERAGDLAQHPDDWLLIDAFYWRPLAEVMLERGYELWRKVWYPPAEKHLIASARNFSDQMEVEFHGAEVGPCRAFGVLGRDEAIATATHLAKARAWFCETFETAKFGRRRELASVPISLAILVFNKEEMVRFNSKFKDEFAIDQAAMEFALAQKMILWTDLGHAHQADDTLWRYQFVSQLGGQLMRWYWHDGFDLPPWIWVAAAHHAEIAAYGTARVPYVAQTKYDQADPKANPTSRDLRDAREAVKDMLKNKKGASIRALFSKSYNALDLDDDNFGLVLMEYLLTEEHEAFLKFLSGSKTGNLWERWDRYLGKSMEQVEGEFKAWL